MENLGISQLWKILLGSGMYAVMFWSQELILNSSGVGLNFWVNFDSWNQNIGAK